MSGYSDEIGLEFKVYKEHKLFRFTCDHEWLMQVGHHVIYLSYE